MNPGDDASAAPDPEAAPPRRRARYRGTHPRTFREKYKEHQPERYVEAVAKVLAAGKTPAGSHRPIMVPEVLAVLAPQPGEIALDCTLGYGGHARALWPRLQPGGRLIGVDTDPIELAKTRERFAEWEPNFRAERGNFAAFAQILARLGFPSVDIILADLGVSSMQFDDPRRGFSFKHDGPLDMRMNPGRSQTAGALLKQLSAPQLKELLEANADEPHAVVLAAALSGQDYTTTTALAAAIRSSLLNLDIEARELSVRRVFQALRIAVNDEYSALETFLRQLPYGLAPGGRVAILTFHSGEDKRVKKAFAEGARAGVYSQIARDVQRPSAAERHANPRSASAKLRWAIRSPLAASG